MSIDDKLEIFRRALAQAFKKISKGTAPTTVVASYGLSPAIITSINKEIKDPQFSTIFRLCECFQIDPITFTNLVIQELPKGFMFADE